MNTNWMSCTLREGCEVCGSQERLVLCSTCNVVQYCTEEHRLEHEATHASTCARIEECRTEVRQQRDILEAAIPQFKFVSEGSENAPEVVEVVDYLRARLQLVEAYSLPENILGLQVSLDNLLEMVKLCRLDKLNFRWMTLGVMLSEPRR
ncbi:hypothetical protein N7532_000730 [Penicillium argentinense]|uniref:MYND-type domain-containing protein n=1 Tax=Penicillium argentinense TaxID=1131581 RepID=A0A9W9G6Q9_9EURO|nr:uncharacterized protein N7532_000730 [Penicillium argentinense]KAJ5112685.1 hypothetical protein N7532_000730 [Penicillium argentinense]